MQQNHITYNELAIPIIKLTIVNNFESLEFLVYSGVCYSSIKLCKLKSGANGEVEIGDSQKPLRIIL